MYVCMYVGMFCLACLERIRKSVKEEERCMQNGLYLGIDDNDKIKHHGRMIDDECWRRGGK